MVTRAQDSLNVMLLPAKLSAAVGSVNLALRSAVWTFHHGTDPLHPLLLFAHPFLSVLYIDIFEIYF